MIRTRRRSFTQRVGGIIAGVVICVALWGMALEIIDAVSNQ